MPSHLERMRKDLELEDSAAPGVQSLDRYACWRRAGCAGGRDPAPADILPLPRLDILCMRPLAPPRFDHIYGVRRTAAEQGPETGHYPGPARGFAMALVGWTGSRTYLRLLRQHAKGRGHVPQLPQVKEMGRRGLAVGGQGVPGGAGRLGLIQAPGAEITTLVTKEQCYSHTLVMSPPKQMNPRFRNKD